MPRFMVASTVPAKESDSDVQGLVDANVLAKLQTTHNTLRQLQHILPRLLKEPMEEATMEESHTIDTCVLVKGEQVLVSDLSEWVRVQHAIVNLVAWEARVENLLTGSRRSSRDLAHSNIQCRLVLMSSNETTTTTDSNFCNSSDAIRIPDQIRVDWKVWLLQGVSSNVAPGVRGLLRGQSVLKLHQGKVSQHVLQRIKLDDQVVDAQAVGQFLSQMRTLVKQYDKNAPPGVKWIQSLVAPNAEQLWEQAIQPWIAPPPKDDKGTQSSRTFGAKLTGGNGTAVPISGSVEPSIVVLTQWITEEGLNGTLARNSSKIASTNASTTPNHTNASKYMDVEEASLRLLVPLPGSQRWAEYSLMCQTVQNFVDYVIPQLASPSPSTDSKLSSFFDSSTKVVLKATDGETILAQGSEDLSRLFTSLASLRQRTGGSWVLKGAELVEKSKDFRTVVVRILYKVQLSPTSSPSRLNIAGGGLMNSAMTLQGSDLYTIKVPTPAPEANDTMLRRFHQKPRPLIQLIDQEVLTVAGNSNAAETTLFMRSLVTALLSSNPQTNPFLRTTAGLVDNSWLWSLWEQRAGSSALPRTFENLGLIQSDESSARVYRILASLHADGQSLVDSTNVNNPPAFEYMTTDVELLGYLNEKILRGKTRFQQSLGFLVSSLKSFLRSGRIISEKAPSTKVELSPELNRVEYTLTLYLQLVPSAFAPKELPFLKISSRDTSKTTKTGEASQNLFPNLSGGRIPLKITLTSEYVLDPETGHIIQQRLLQSLVNGQLTPADLLIRWIRRGTISGDTSNRNPLEGLSDLLQLIRSSSSSS